MKAQHLAVLSLITIASVTVVFFSSCGSSAKLTGDMATVRENNSVVIDFTNYVDANNHLTPDHHYIQTELKMLADAVSAMSKEVEHTVTADLSLSNRHADSITNNANETTHADHIRKAADILSAELKSLQRARFWAMSSEGDLVVNNAAAIQPAVLTRNQKTTIMNFFSASASILRKMN